MTLVNFISPNGLVNIEFKTDILGWNQGTGDFTIMEVRNKAASLTTEAEYLMNAFPRNKTSWAAMEAYAVANSLRIEITELGAATQTAQVGNTVTLAAPTAPDGTVNSATQVTVVWTKTPGATGYIVERATNVGFTTGLVAFTVGGVATKAVTGLTTATQYWFRVRATAPYATTSANSTTVTKTTS